MKFFLLNGNEIFKYFQGNKLPFTAISLTYFLIVLVSGILIYNFKKQWKRDYLIALVASLIMYIVMCIKDFYKIKDESQKIIVKTILIGFILILIFSGILILFLNKKFTERFTKKQLSIINFSLITIFILVALILFIVSSVETSKTASISKNIDEKNKTFKSFIVYNFNIQQILYISIAFLLVVFALAIYFFRYKNEILNKFKSKIIADASIAIAMSFALSYVRLFKMPAGGAITLGSVLPIAIFSYIYGTKLGLQVGFIYSLLQIVQDPYFLHPIQVILDYIIGFSFIGIAGIFKFINIKSLSIKNKNLSPALNFSLGLLLYGIIRFISGFLSGSIFFAYATNAAIIDKIIFSKESTLYALTYQLYILADIGIALLLGIPLIISKQFERIIKERELILK